MTMESQGMKGAFSTYMSVKEYERLGKEKADAKFKRHMEWREREYQLALAEMKKWGKDKV